jgi:hypothetical protein
MTKLIPLRINRKRWARGSKNGNSELLNSEGNMCCLGFACRKLGLKPDDILNMGTPASAVALLETSKHAMLDPLVTKQMCNRAAVRLAVYENDDTLISDDVREARLVPILAQLGFKVSFVG